MSKLPVVALAASLAVSALALAPASAHHSYAMFERGKIISLEGTVRTWEMGNPHAYLWIDVTKDGQTNLWGLEGPSPAALIRKGWSKYTVKPGDKVTVFINPLRDGRNGGNLAKLVLADGRELGSGVGLEDRSAEGKGKGGQAEAGEP